MVETTIEDTYAMTVEITYEADIPEPKLFVSPILFCPGESPQFLVSNVGPLTMTDIVLNASHQGVSFSPGQVALGDLAPGETYTGTLATSGDEAVQFGTLQATATVSDTQASYQTSSRSKKICVTESDSGGGDEEPDSSGGSWTWHWTPQPGGKPKIVGSYQGSRPDFPSESTDPPPPDDDHEVAKLILSGEATLERQAFLATLQLTSQGQGLVEDIHVDIEARGPDGLAVVDGFAVIPPVPTALGDLPNGSVLEQQWTLVPGDLGITDPNGEVYALRAQIVYTMSGQVFTTTLPEQITILPQPRIRLTYSHSQPDSGGDFYVQVKADNQGYGLARKFKLDLNQVTTLGDLDMNGRSLIFDLKQTTLDGVAQPNVYIFDFGDLQPGQKKTGRWDIGVRASDGAPLVNQRVTGFEVTCRHLPYEGVELSSLIANCGPVNQYFLADECPFCGISEKNAVVGGPINTGNGNYTYSQNTPSIPTVGNPLQFQWTYNSLGSGASPLLPAAGSRLGPGWTHNYHMNLDLSGVNGPANSVVFNAAHGTPLYFEKVRDSYQAAPGVRATLTRTEIITGQYVYTLTAPNQATYVFTNTGRLLRQIDPQGNALAFAYDEQDM